MNLTNAEEARLLELSTQGTRLALLSAQGDEDAPGDEIEGASYLRMAVQFGTPDLATGSVANDQSIFFIDLPGALLVGWELWSADGEERRWFGYWSPTIATWSATGFATIDPHGLVADEPILFLPGRAPTGLAANTLYYVRDVTGTSFNVSTTIGGAAMAFVDDGEAIFGKTVHIPAGESLQIEPGELILTMD